MKRIIFVLTVLLSTQVHSSIIFSAGYGVAGLTTSALTDRKGTAAGKSMIFKLGFMPSKIMEIGAYSSNASFLTNIKHDDTDSELEYTKQSFGIYTTYYRKKIYLEFAYGKSSVNEKLKGSLTSSEINVINDVYDIHEDTLSGDEGKLLVGLKVFTFGEFITTIYAQKVMQFSSSHQENLVGFELKMKI